jgi:hypothetical protein
MQPGTEPAGAQLSGLFCLTIECLRLTVPAGLKIPPPVLLVMMI